MPKKKHDPADIHRTHGVGDTPEYVERSLLATERLGLKRRLVANRREEEQQARRLALPGELERQRRAVADRSAAAVAVAAGVDSRHTEWASWAKHVEDNYQERERGTVERVRQEGARLYNDREKHLFIGTGMRDDSLKLAADDLRAEARLYGGARDLFAESPEMRADFAEMGSIDHQLMELRRRQVLGEAELRRKEEYLKRMNRVRGYVQRLEADDKQSQLGVEKMEADLSARTERMKVAGPGMDFAARGAARRELMEQKEAFEILQGHARAVRMERDKWRMHVQYNGYNPDAVPPMQDIEKLNVIEVLTKEERIARKKAEAARLLAERQNKAKRAKGDPYGNAERKKKSEEDAKPPPPLEEIIASAPPPKPGTFKDLVLKGHSMVTETREAMKKDALDRRNAVEDAEAHADQERILAASSALANISGSGGDEKAAAAAALHVEDINNSSSAEFEQTLSAPDTTTTSNAAAAAVALQAPNVFYQRAEDDAMVAKLGGGGSIVSGVDKSQVPNLCREWVMLCCPNEPSLCPRRHYYTSAEEKAMAVSRRQKVDARLERRVVECLTQREDLIRLLRRAAADATRKFMDHTDAHVRDEDVKTLLDLLAQMRVSSVESIEAIVEWRNAVAEARTKLKLNSQEDGDDDDDDGSKARKRKTEKERKEKARGEAGGSRSTPWRSPKKRSPKKKLVGMVQTEPIKYSVKIAVEGDQLYGGCEPYKALLKRFNRGRTMPKKAVNWVFLGIVNSEAEAALLYDRARGEQAVLHATTAERMPPRRTYIRRCGHYSVESVGAGVPKSRCEICYVNALDVGSKLTVPYLWNGINYLQKIPHDLDFLKEVEPLQLYLGKKFPLQRNPFLLVRRMGEPQKEYVKPTLGAGGTKRERGMAFGVPGAQVIKYDNGTTEWYGHISSEKGGKTFQVGDKHRMYDGFNQMPFNERAMKKFVKKNSGDQVTVLDVTRISSAERVLLEEEDLAKLMNSLNSGLNDEIEQHGMSASSGGDTTEGPSGMSGMSATESSNGSEDGGSPRQVDGGGACSPSGHGMSSPAKGDATRGVASTTASSGGGSSPGRKKKKKRKPDSKSRSGSRSPSKSPKKKHDKNTLPPGEDGWEVESDDEIEAEEKRDSWFRMNEKQRKEHELRSRMMQKVAYYEQGGVKLPVVQHRLPNASRKPGLWMNPYEGEYKIAFDGQRFQKYGFMVRGKRSQHNYFEIKLKVDGEKKRALRAKVQRLLQKSIRNPDLIDVKRVALLIKFGREIKGSLVILDCTRAEQAVLRYRRRVEACVAVQRVFRGHQSRTWAASIRYERRLRLKLRVAREVACALTARKLVTGFLRDGILAARNRVVEPEYSTTIEMQEESCVVQVFRSAHHDWKHLKKTTQRCFSCMQWRPKARWDMAEQRMAINHGPCCCKTVLPTERLFIRAYSPMQSVVYSLAVTEADMKRRMLLDQYRRFGKGSVNSSIVMRALRHEKMPETDYVLGKNIGIYSRDRFEPLKEAHLARDRSTASENIARAHELHAGRMEQAADDADVRAVAATEFAARMKQLWQSTQADLLRSQVQLQALIYASSNAMDFVQSQLRMFAAMDQAVEAGGEVADMPKDPSLSLDPLENANDHVWIKRKYEAKKSMILRVQDRERSREIHLRAQVSMLDAKDDAKRQRIVAVEARRRAVIFRKEAEICKEQTKVVLAVKKEVTARICRMLTLRTLPNSQLQRVLTFAEPEWDIQMPKPLRPVPLVFGGWNVRHREVRYVNGQSFCEKGHRPSKRLLMLSVMEDPLSTKMRKTPPHTGMLVLIIYDPQSRQRTVMNFGPDELRDALGEPHPELFAPVEEDADTMFVCPTPGCRHRLRARRRLTSERESEPSYRRPPFSGLNIGVEGGNANGGGPVLRCPKCSIVLKSGGPDRWSLVPAKNGAKRNGASHNASGGHNQHRYAGQVASFQTEPACDSVVDREGKDGGIVKAGEPADAFEVKNQKIVTFYHGGYTQRLAVFQERRNLVIEKLCGLLQLSRFDQNTVCLDGLSYRSCRRLFKGRIARTQWMRDHIRGRTSLKGIHIFTEGRKIGGKLVHIDVHENHGDLCFEAYHSRSGFACTLLVKGVDVAQALSDDPKWVDYWESSVRTCKYSPDLLRTVCDRLTFVTLPLGKAQVSTPWEGHSRYAIDVQYSEAMKEDPRLRELPGHGRGTRTETIPSAPILVMRKAKRLAFQVRHQEYRIVSSKYVLCSILENTRGELLLEAHDPKTAQRHTLQLAREQCRVLLRTKLDLLCNRGQSLWEHMCSLMVLRPDPEAGRAATLRLNLAKLEVVAEEAALKCVETKRKINKVEDAKSDALVERRRLKDLSLAARDLAEGDGGAMKPITLLRMLEFNMQRAKKEFLRSCTVVRRLKELYSRLSDSLFEETLERQKRIRASAAMRRLLVEQRSKDGLLLALSDARPDEHWKRVWVGTRAFGGTLLDLEKDEHAAAASSSTTKSPHPPLVAKAEVNADLPYDPERYLLRGANYVVLEVLTRPRGTKTDTSDVWIRARFETRWEQEQRTMREEMLLMDYEERRTRRVMKVTAEMKLRLEAQRIAKRKAAREKRIEDRKLRAMLRLENEAKKRLQRLAALARTLGETVGLRWDEKIAKPRTRPPSAAGGAPPAPEAASALPPPGLMEGVIGQPLEWDKLSETFPLGNGATRTVIGTGMDPRELKQIAEGGTKRRNKDKGSSAAGGGDAPQDETLIPRLKARASKWGLANGPKGCAMYPCVFEMLRYRVGGQMKKRNKRMKAMFVPADEVIPPEKEAMALLTLAQAEYDPIKAKYDEYYTLANDEEANYEDKTKAEAKLLPVSKALEKVKADLDLAQAAYDEAQATADAIAKANSKDANKSEYYESDEEDDPEAPGYVPPPHVPKMFGIDIAPPGTHRFDREWFDNPRTATMYPCVAQMLGLNDDGYLLEHPANALNDEDFYASMAEEDSQLDIRHEEQGTTNGNILIIQGDAVDAPAFAEGALDLRRLTRKNVDRLGGNSQRESRPPSAVSMRSSSRFSARSSRPSTANSKSGSRQKKKKRRSDNDISVWLPEGMHAWTEKDLEANDSKFIRERAVALRKAESDAKSDPNPTAEAKARALRESNKIIDTTLAPSVAPPPVEVALALRIRGAFNAARGVPARSRKWRRKRRRIPKSFKDRDTGEEVKQNEMPSFRFSHSNPLSLTDQHNMEADARAMGKVWFRCIRKVPVGMNKREQIKFARDPTSVKQEYRRVIVTVQSAPMPASQSRRLNSAIDISSVMRVEMYDPSTSKAHVAVIDADDVAGQRWSKHVKANRSVQILVGHLRMHYDYASTGGERTTMSAAKATSKENSRPGLRGPMIGFGPLVECYDWKVTTHPRSARYCRRSSLLPWACGTGSELYTTKAWQNGPAVPPQYAADRPKPLFRGTRLIKDFTGKPYRVLVSAWREMSTGGKNSGGCRIDVYYPPTSQCWTIQVGPQELEIMTDKMEAAARAVAKIETEKKGDGKMKGKKKKKKKVDESVVVSRGPLTPEEVKLQLLIAHENSRLETLVDWAPERKRILAERAKRKKKAVEAALRAKENDEESKKLDPTPPGRRELAWLTKVLAIDRHPATGVVQPPKKMKGRRKLWQQRKKLDAKNGKGKQKPNKHAQVQIAKGIAAVMAAAVVNRAGRSFAEVPSASTMKQSVDKAMAKLLPVPPKNGAADANTADMDGPEQGKDGQVINGKKRNKEKMGKRKKGKGKKKKKKQTEGSDTEETGSDDIAGEEDMDEDMFRQMFVEEVTSERLRIRPNTAYDDGTKTSKSRLRKKGGASSSLDLVEAEGVASMSEFSRSSKLFQAPDEGADDLPQHFSGLFIPRNARAPMRIIYFKLSSWQQQVHSVLEQGTRSHQEYYEGMDELEAMDDASLEHRSVKTGAGNARKVFDKNKNAKVNLTTADKQKIEEEEGRMFTNVAEKKSTPENNWHIQRMTVNAGEGAVFNRIMRPAPLCASDTKEQNGYSGTGSEAAATEQDKAAAQDSVDDIQQDAEAAPPREKPINLRASVLCATDIEGDAVWMRRDGDEEIAGMLQADRNAILRFLNEEKARKKEEEERARKQRLLEQQQSTRSKLRRRSSAARSPPTSSSPGAGEGSLSSSTLSVQEVGGDTLPSSLHSQPMLDDSLKNVLNISVEEGAADQARQLEAESKKSETLEESKYQGKQEPNGESSDDHPGSSDDEATADITGDDFSTASSIGKNSLLIPRWKKALNERRGLKRSCKPPKVDERLAEATHAKGVVHAHKLVDTEVIASDEILQRRLYRRSPIDAGVPIAPPGLQGERNDVAKANHRVVLSLKLHRYEISALAAASRQGNANICKGDQPLGHRPAYDVEALRGWIRTRLTLRKIPLKGALQKTSSRSRKPFRQKPEDMAVTHRWKLSVDRTIVKEVRRLPPHSTLMILHAVRVAGLLKDKDESYGVSSGGGNAGSSSAGGKKKKKRALGHQARNGRNASLMIVGHNPMTGEQMTMVPDISVLETATGSDKDPSLSYLFKGGSRHENMRRAAEKVIDQLVVMKRNGRPTLSHIRMRWVQEALRRAAEAAALEKAFQMEERRARSLRIALQALCQRTRMRRYRMGVLARRAGLHLREIPEPTHEWGPMLREDLSAHEFRRFLTADKKEFIAIRAAFDMFDADQSGSIDAREFQSLCFEIGEVLNKRQVAAAVQAIDRDGSGAIEFDEFAMWWVTSDHGSGESGSLSASKMARLKAALARRRWRRQAKEKLYIKMRSARLAGKHYSQRRQAAREAKREKMAKVRARRERLAAMRRGEFGFAAAAAQAAGPSAFDAQAGDVGRLARREKPWDGIPGGAVGRVIFSPYWATRWEIKKRMRARQLQKERKEAAEEVERERKRALEEEAAEKLRKVLEEEERLAKEEEAKKEKELQEARRLASEAARQAREKLLEEERLKEEAEEKKRKEDEAARRKEAAKKALEERRKKEEEERIARLELDNKEEYDRIMAEKAEAERLAKEEEERKIKEEQQKKRDEIAKKMEEQMAKQRKEAKANSKDAKKEKEKKEQAEREKRQARLRRRAGGGGGAGGKRGASKRGAGGRGAGGSKRSRR